MKGKKVKCCFLNKTKQKVSQKDIKEFVGKHLDLIIEASMSNDYEKFSFTFDFKDVKTIMKYWAKKGYKKGFANMTLNFIKVGECYK
jgi:hypothetical protein